MRLRSYCTKLKLECLACEKDVCGSAFTSCERCPRFMNLFWFTSLLEPLRKPSHYFNFLHNYISGHVVRVSKGFSIASGNYKHCENYKPVSVGAYKAWTTMLKKGLLEAGIDDRLWNSQLGFRKNVAQMMPDSWQKDALKRRRRHGAKCICWHWIGRRPSIAWALQVCWKR